LRSKNLFRMRPPPVKGSAIDCCGGRIHKSTLRCWGLPWTWRSCTMSAPTATSSRAKVLFDDQCDFGLKWFCEREAALSHSMCGGTP
jgi:hypothetical protein